MGIVTDLHAVRHDLATVVLDLDRLDELLAGARHESDDDAARIELHAIDDDVTQAWAHAQRAKHALDEFLAVKP